MRRCIWSPCKALAAALLGFLVIVAAPHGVQGKVKFDKDGRVSLLGALKHFTGWDPADDEAPLPGPQKMVVIGAGQGRTGTTSLVRALAMLGVESYHMSKIFETTGHLDLWYDFYVKKSLTFDQLIDRITQDGFNATMDVPLNLHFEKLMDRYPEALVILSLRKDGAEGWVKSLLESVFLLHPVLRRPPLSWLPRAKRQKEFFAAMNRDMGLPLDPATDLPLRESLAPEYDRWTRHVQETVPPEKLLVFHAQDGWKPLCDFLSPLSPEVERNCQKVMESGEPYPHVNEKAMMQKLVFAMNLFCTLCQVAPVLVVLFLLIKFARSRNKVTKVKRT